jgi:hypothetical protein
MAKITLADGTIIEGTVEEFRQIGVKLPVEENAEVEKWSKIGRKPNEFKIGDIVRVDNPCGSPLKKGDLAKVTYDSTHMSRVIVTDEKWGVSVSELITPVEARFDL